MEFYARQPDYKKVSFDDSRKEVLERIVIIIATHRRLVDL